MKPLTAKEFKLVLPLLIEKINEAVENYNGCIQLEDFRSAKAWSETLLEFSRAKDILSGLSDPKFVSQKVEFIQLDKLKNKLLSMRYTEGEMKLKNTEELFQAYGWSECINKLLEWINKSKLERK